MDIHIAALVRRGDLKAIICIIAADDNFSKFAFICACSHGKLKIARWIFKMKPTYDHSTRSAFIAACYNGHLHVAKWLQKVRPPILYSYQWPTSCSVAYRDNHFHVAKWLIRLKPSINAKIDENIPHKDFLHAINKRVVHLVSFFN
jgi:hypothetical protein